MASVAEIDMESSPHYACTHSSAPDGLPTARGKAGAEAPWRETGSDGQEQMCEMPHQPLFHPFFIFNVTIGKTMTP